MDALLPPGIVHTWRSGTALSHETRCETCGWRSGAHFWRRTAVGAGRDHWLAEHVVSREFSRALASKGK